MALPRASVIPVCLLFAACSSDGTQSTNVAYRVAASLDAVAGADAAQTAFGNVLREHRGVVAVVAYDDALAEGVAVACDTAQRSDVRVVGVASSVSTAKQLVTDGKRAANCACAAAPAAAIDVALLACSGIAVPKDLGLGVDWFTKNNVAAGGTHEAAPGDFALATTRSQQAETLTTTPAIDVVFRIGLVDGGGAAPGGAALRAELVAAAKRYPQVRLDVGPASADAEQQLATARKFVEKNYNGLLVVADASDALAPIRAEANKQGIKVIVLGAAPGGDDHVAWIHADDEALGRAAGNAIRQVLSGGGEVAIVSSDSREASAARNRALLRTLGAKSP